MSTTKGRGDINTTGDDIVLKSGETDQVTISAGDNASAATHITPDNSSVLVGAEHGGDATKKVAFDSSGATTSTKSTIAASQTTDRTITLPDASDTLVGKATTDTLTNKTIDGDNNTISNLAHGAEVDNPTSGVHGATGSIVGTSDAQTLTNKTIDADNNTISNLAHGAEVDNPSSGVHGVSGSVVGTTDTQTLTNKTLQDSTTSIVDNADATKAFKFEVSGVTTATTRTATVPDADFTIVGTATSQTLTNKTIDGDNNTISNLAHGAEVDNPSSGVHGVTGNVVGTTDTQALTNKDIDGGTASNSLRITLPKNTTTNLNALTRKEATLVFDTDTSQVKYDDGATLTALSATSVATPTTTGTVTSYVPTIQSRINTVSSANYTILDTDGYDKIAVSTGASDRTITLPTAADNTGRVVEIIKTDTGVGGVIVDGEVAETINGNATAKIHGQYDSIKVLCDGSGWIITERKSTVTIALDSSFSAANLIINRSGDSVTITEDAAPTHGSASSPNSSSGFIPTGFRPPANVQTQYFYDSSGAGVIRVDSDGTYRHLYYTTAGASTSRTNSGGFIGTISYTTTDV